MIEVTSTLVKSEWGLGSCVLFLRYHHDWAECLSLSRLTSRYRAFGCRSCETSYLPSWHWYQPSSQWQRALAVLTGVSAPERQRRWQRERGIKRSTGGERKSVHCSPFLAARALSESLTPRQPLRGKVLVKQKEVEKRVAHSWAYCWPRKLRQTNWTMKRRHPFVAHLHLWCIFLQDVGRAAFLPYFVWTHRCVCVCLQVHVCVYVWVLPAVGFPSSGAVWPECILSSPERLVSGRPLRGSGCRSRSY